MTTIYISGAMSGLDEHEVIKNFQEAEQLLESIGFKPVSPLGVYQRSRQIKMEIPETPDEQIWDMAMIEAIQLLLPCHGIFMMSNWSESRGARIERNISVEKGKFVLYEMMLNEKTQKIQLVKDAIHEIMGLRFQEYIGEDRCRYAYFARLIFAHQCLQLECLELPEITSMLNRSFINAKNYPTKYEKERRYNKRFRAYAVQVDKYIESKCSLI